MRGLPARQVAREPLDLLVRLEYLDRPAQPAMLELRDQPGLQARLRLWLALRGRLERLE